MRGTAKTKNENADRSVVRLTVKIIRKLAHYFRNTLGFWSSINAGALATQLSGPGVTLMCVF